MLSIIFMSIAGLLIIALWAFVIAETILKKRAGGARGQSRVVGWLSAAIGVLFLMAVGAQFAGGGEAFVSIWLLLLLGLAFTYMGAGILLRRRVR